MSTALKRKSRDLQDGEVEMPAQIKVRQISVSKMEKSCQEVSDLLRAISHPQRLMIMGHLIQGPKTVSELQEKCEISQSQLSQFLARMKLEGLITCERQGKYQYYSASDERVVRLIGAIQAIYCH